MTQQEKIKLKTLFIQVFNNEPGYRVLQFIMNELCGYQLPNTSMTAMGDLSVHAMLHNEGRRGVYLDLRKFLSEDILKKVELDQGVYAGKSKKKGRGKTKRVEQE